MLQKPTAEALSLSHIQAALAAEQARRRHTAVSHAEQARLNDDIEASRERCKDLMTFVREAWHVLEPNESFIDGWHLHAMAEHLMAVSTGKIQHLAVHVPPGSMKSLMFSVMWPAHEWGPQMRAGLKYMSGSYEETLAERDNRKMRRLIESSWYQARWPLKLTKTGDQLFENAIGGERRARAFMSMTGGRANRLLLDDPHSTDTAESDTKRAKGVLTFRESLQDRLNNQQRDSIILAMQRLHANDIGGTIEQLGLGFERLVIPMEWENPPQKHYPVSSLGWKDPRSVEGELMCPERWPAESVANLKKAKGSYAYAGQYQQRPVPREGGMFQTAWFPAEKCIDASRVPAGVVWVRHWDLAATKHKATNLTGARTAGVKLGRSADGRYFVGGCIAKGIEGKAVRDLIESTANDLDGPLVTISLPQDPGQAGKVQKGDFAVQLDGFKVQFLSEGLLGDKEARAEPFSVQCEAGNTWIVGDFADAWVQEWIEEMCNFPGGARKDIPDATSGAYARLSPRRKKRRGLAGPEVFNEASEKATLARKIKPNGHFSVYD